MPANDLPATYLIGLDYGSESARGVLVNVRTGQVEADHVQAYRHGVMDASLPDGSHLPSRWALQDAADYLACAETILARLGRGRVVEGIGIGFTASSPLPALTDGTPLSRLHPRERHAYVKLWKHAASQPWADRLGETHGDAVAGAGGRMSANSLPARAAELAEEAPDLWARAERFIEAGDWLVWQLTGHERRSYAFATYKAYYRPGHGYPEGLVPGLDRRLAEPEPVGTPAGPLCSAWRERTGILGEATVGVAVIDSHVVMPAVGAVQSGTLVGAVGTSAVFLMLDERDRPLPAGIEGVARDATIRGLSCFEAGQAGFGDVLGWFVRAFPLGAGTAESFGAYNEGAARLAPGETGLVALDWFNGNRVPHGDATLTGLFAGMTLRSTGVHLYRALLESLCFGARTIVGLLDMPVERIVLTSGLSLNSPLLMQLMADILGRDVEVPQQPHLTAVGAAIHGAVAAGVVRDYREGARRFGATEIRVYKADAEAHRLYDGVFAAYGSIGGSKPVREAMHALRAAQR